MLAASHDLMKDGRAVSQLSVQLSYQLKDGIPVHDERAFSKFVHPLTQALSGIEELAVLVREVRGIPKVTFYLADESDTDCLPCFLQ
jgi:hypothetical protein